MKILVLMSFFVAGNVIAMPGFDDLAPESTVRACVDQIALQANYGDTGRVRHEIESRQRRVSGHTLTIDTMVFDESGDQVVRAYATKCAVARNNDMKLFKIRSKDIR